MIKYWTVHGRQLSDQELAAHIKVLRDRCEISPTPTEEQTAAYYAALEKAQGAEEKRAA